MALENKSRNLLTIVSMEHNWPSDNPAIALLAAAEHSKGKVGSS